MKGLQIYVLVLEDAKSGKKTSDEEETVAPNTARLSCPNLKL